jgi:hypothetical protein
MHLPASNRLPRSVRLSPESASILSQEVAEDMQGVTIGILIFVNAEAMMRG